MESNTQSGSRGAASWWVFSSYGMGGCSRAGASCMRRDALARAQGPQPPDRMLLQVTPLVEVSSRSAVARHVTPMAWSHVSGATHTSTGSRLAGSEIVGWWHVDAAVCPAEISADPPHPCALASRHWSGALASGWGTAASCVGLMAGLWVGLSLPLRRVSGAARGTSTGRTSI